MLKKEMCIRCYDEHRCRRWADLPSKDRMWEDGRVMCVSLLNQTHNHGDSWILVAGKPPMSCPYIVEHVVNEPS